MLPTVENLQYHNSWHQSVDEQNADGDDVKGHATCGRRHELHTVRMNEDTVAYAAITAFEQLRSRSVTCVTPQDLHEGFHRVIAGLVHQSVLESPQLLEIRHATGLVAEKIAGRSRIKATALRNDAVDDSVKSALCVLGSQGFRYAPFIDMKSISGFAIHEVACAVPLLGTAQGLWLMGQAIRNAVRARASAYNTDEAERIATALLEARESV